MSYLKDVKSYAKAIEGSSPKYMGGKLFCKLTGVTFDDRQETISKVDSNTLLRISRDRSNRYDFNAVKVQAFVNNTWKDLGFVPATMNKSVSHSLDSGEKHDVSLVNITGGGNGYHLGISVEIKKKG